ncbi:MAG TPA: hypothetical protein ENJ56_00960 [Anaerolineae bacterium]|nr:hypothetical protein [Anaerolineae bacterium]
MPLLTHPLANLPQTTEIVPDFHVPVGDVASYEQRAEQSVPPLPTGRVRMTQVAERAAILATVAEGLGAPDNATAHQMAAGTALQITGADGADRLGQLVQQRGAQPVQEAIEQVARVQARYRSGGQSAEDIVETFATPKGRGVRDVERGLIDSPLSRRDIQAVAAMTLQPELVLTRAELATEITQATWRREASEASLTKHLQVTGFENHTAAVREAAQVIATSGLEAITVQQLVSDIERGDKAAARKRLKQHNVPNSQHAAIVSSLEQLPPQARLRRHFRPIVDEAVDEPI